MLSSVGDTHEIACVCAMFPGLTETPGKQLLREWLPQPSPELTVLCPVFHGALTRGQETRVDCSVPAFHGVLPMGPKPHHLFQNLRAMPRASECSSDRCHPIPSLVLDQLLTPK